MPFELVLDRIFDRDDLSVRFVDEVEAAVKRRRLARTGRTRDQQDSVRQRDQSFEGAASSAKKPNSGNPSVRPSLSRIRITMLSPCAVGSDDDAEIELLAADADLNAAVLRDAFLGDADVRHDLQPGNNRELQPLRRVLDFDQDAVDAVADAKPFFEWLDVNVRRAPLNRLQNDLVHQLDDRCVRVGVRRIDSSPGSVVTAAFSPAPPVTDKSFSRSSIELASLP